MAGVKDILFAFSEEARLRMALLLEGSTLCVSCLVKALDMPQPTISRHLSILRMTGVARTRRDGLHSYYTLNEQDEEGRLINGLVRTYGASLGGIEPFSGDVKRLIKLAEACTADCRVKIRPRRKAHEKVH